MKRRKAHLAIAMGLFGCMTAVQGCRQRPVKRSEVCGSYVADYAVGTDKLTLKSNSQFSQEITLKGSNTTAQSSGKWRFDETHQEVVLIEGGLLLVDAWGQIRADWRTSPTGVLIYPVVVTMGGRIQLGAHTVEVLVPYKRVTEGEKQ